MTADRYSTLADTVRAALPVVQRRGMEHSVLIDPWHVALDELEQAARHFAQYEDRGDFVVYRAEWDDLQRKAQSVAAMADQLAWVSSVNKELLPYQERALHAEARVEALTARVDELEQAAREAYYRAPPDDLRVWSKMMDRVAELEAALREIAESNGRKDESGCTCGHKENFCHRRNAALWCGSYNAPARARAALGEQP